MTINLSLAPYVIFPSARGSNSFFLFSKLFLKERIKVEQWKHNTMLYNRLKHTTFRVV